MFFLPKPIFRKYFIFETGFKTAIEFKEYKTFSKMENSEEIIEVTTLEKYQELIQRVRETKKPVKFSLGSGMLYYENVDITGVRIRLGYEFDMIVPETASL